MTTMLGYLEPPPVPEDFAVGATPAANVVLVCPLCSWQLVVDPFDEKADTLGSLLGEAVDHVGDRHPQRHEPPDFFA